MQYYIYSVKFSKKYCAQQKSVILKHKAIYIELKIPLVLVNKLKLVGNQNEILEKFK